MGLRIISLREQLSRWYKRLGYGEAGTAPFTHRLVERPCHFIELVKPLTPSGRSTSAV
jgi:hypothetical protein